MSSGSTNVHDMLAILRERRRRLPFEIGAFVALQATESLLDRPRDAGAKAIHVLEDGTVDLSRADPADERTAIKALHGVLVALLAAAGEGVPPMLLDLVERPADAEDLSLARFRDELEASLVPLNRSAAKRVLARTLRDLARAGSGPKSATGADPDADLDALLEGRGAPEADEVVLPAPDSLPSRVDRPTASREGRSIFSDRQLRDLDDDDDDEPSSGSSWGLRLSVAALVLAAVGAVAFALRGTPSDERDAPRRANARRPAATASRNEAARAEIEIEVQPEGAAVRLYVGRVPTLADGVPVGVAQELLAVGDDDAALRFTVPSSAPYRDVDGLPELVVNIDGTPVDEAAAVGSTDLRSETMGRPSGRVGRLRIDSPLAHAKVYRTIGFAPLARLTGAPTDRATELFVTARGFVSQRIVISPSDFRDDHGVQRATARVSLEPARVLAPAP